MFKSWARLGGEWSREKGVLAVVLKEERWGIRRYLSQYEEED